ncbi:DEAD/DEAH box helicase (plasmid) [Pseudoalteromonas espejiana]
MRLGNLSLASVKHLVLDEADVCLIWALLKICKSVIKSCDEQRQILLFSASFQLRLNGCF